MFTKTTEQSSNYNHLEKMSVSELLQNINNEDKTVAFSVEKAIPQIENLVVQIVEKLKNGGRLFYIGAGTSGRLGIVDASEVILPSEKPLNLQKTTVNKLGKIY
jgi:N-acetylmuramic acid 6-phosphate etherase